MTKQKLSKGGEKVREKLTGNDSDYIKELVFTEKDRGLKSPIDIMRAVLNDMVYSGLDTKNELLIMRTICKFIRRTPRMKWSGK